MILALLTAAAASRRASAEWDYLRSERLWLFTLLVAGAGVLMPLLERAGLSTVQIDLLGLLLCTAAAATYALGRRTLLSAQLLIASCLLSVTLLMVWLSTPGVLALYIVPVSMAMLFLESRQVLGIICLVEALVWLLPGPGLGLRIVVSLTLAVVCLAGWQSAAARQELIEKTLEYYEAARRALEEARNHQLALHQANEDLAKAYAQLARLNELLQTSRLEAELALRAKETFVANVSHELRTPLNMIIGFSEVIQRSAIANHGALPDNLLADLGVIHRNSRHLAQLIDDVLDLSQLEMGQMSLHREPVAVADLVKEAVETVRPLFQAKGLSLTIELSHDLPTVFWDRLRVRQVLLNLLSNAGRFTQLGGVTVIAETCAQEVQLSVRDTGPGIPLAEQKRIFEPFEQLDGSIKRAFNGTGLGLSISKRLVELHGGRLWLDSAPGRGSTFYVALPKEVVPHGNGAVPRGDVTRWVNPYLHYQPPPRSRTVSPPKVRPRVVVLETQEVLHHQTQVYLQDAEVVCVETLDALCAEVQHTPPHLVMINDYQVMERRESVRTLLKLPPRTPIISCYVPGLREACERLKVVDYLLKPVSEARLLATVQHMCPPGGTILVVEDDPDMARLIVRQLSASPHRYRILRATQGERALALMRSRKPDAVLLDLGLPNLDGYEVLSAKNADPTIQAIPVAIVSARDPWGAPVLVSRLRVELPSGLSARDVIACAAAVTQALSPKGLSPESEWLINPTG